MGSILGPVELALIVVGLGAVVPIAFAVRSRGQEGSHAGSDGGGAALMRSDGDGSDGGGDAGGDCGGGD